MLVEVDRSGQSETEEGLGHWRLVKWAKAVVKLRVHVLLRIILDAYGRPRKVFKVVTKLDEKDAIVTIYKVDLLFDLGRPTLALVGPVPLPFAGAPRVPQFKQVYLLALLVSNLMDRNQ